jgi:uncharacterized small protein (DUF1192 family)
MNTQRIKRLRNRISRNEKRLAAWKSSKKHRDWLFKIVDESVQAEGDPGDSEDDIADKIAERLDKLINPPGKIAEWLSDVGIDIAAWVAVAVYMGTADRLTKRIARLKKKLAKLEAGTKAPPKKASKKKATP